MFRDAVHVEFAREQAAWQAERQRFASELARSIVLVVAAVVGHLMRQEALDRMGKRARLSTKRSLSHSLSAAVVLVAKALQQARREEVRSERRAARGGEGEERGVEGGGRGRNERERRGGARSLMRHRRSALTAQHRK